MVRRDLAAGSTTPPLVDQEGVGLRRTDAAASSTEARVDPRPGEWRRVVHLFDGHRRKAALVAILAFAGGAVEAAYLVLVARVALGLTDDDVDLEVVGRALSTGTAVAVAAGLVAIRVAMALASTATSTHLLATISREVRVGLADAFLRASWATQHAERADHLRAALGAAAAGARGAASASLAMLLAGANVVALLVVATALNPLATVGILAALVLFGWMLTPLRRRVRSIARTATNDGLELSSAVSELSAMGLEMHVFGVRDQFSRRIRSRIAAESESSRRADLASGMLAPVYVALTYLAVLGGIVIVAGAVSGEAAGVAAVMLVMLRTLTYGQSIQSALGALKAALPRLDVLDETLERYSADPAPIGTVSVDRVGRIEFTDVSFGYGTGEHVLDRVSLAIDPGEVVGIIGPSGSGKSTLVQLLLGLREPRAGTVTIGGVDLRDVDRTCWSSLSAFVAQEAVLVSGSIDDNVRFFRADISDGQVRDATSAARITADIADMPDGLATEVGERGNRLSGGQRQRVAIARALVGRPGLLVLDEPTSALDVRSEALIRRSIADLKGDTTVVIIAHRLSTLDVCDRIVILERGRVTGFDTRAALIENDPNFREILAMSGLAAD